VKIMRRILGALMMIPLLLLAGCGGESLEAQAARLNAPLAAAETVDVTGEMTLDYGQRIATFTLNYVGDTENGVVTVLFPESIAGIRLELQDGMIVMDLDTVKLDSGTLDREGLAPITVLPTVLEAMREGYVVACTRETLDGRACLRTLYQLGSADLSEADALLCGVWVDEADGTPVYAEISVGGTAVVKCEFLAFTAVE